MSEMSREKAIEYLEWIRPKKPYTLDKNNVQTAIDMAIEDMKEMDRLSKLERPHITNEQISDAFQVAIANYWEEKSKHLTPPPSPQLPCCDFKNKMGHGEWIIIDDCEHFIAKCSVCGRIEDSRLIKNYPFCRCGADMRPKGGDER